MGRGRVAKTAPNGGKECWGHGGGLSAVRTAEFWSAACWNACDAQKPGGLALN